MGAPRVIIGGSPGLLLGGPQGYIGGGPRGHDGDTVHPPFTPPALSPRFGVPPPPNPAPPPPGFPRVEPPEWGSSALTAPPSSGSVQDGGAHRAAAAAVSGPRGAERRVRRVAIGGLSRYSPPRATQGQRRAGGPLETASGSAALRAAMLYGTRRAAGTSASGGGVWSGCGGAGAPPFVCSPQLIAHFGGVQPPTPPPHTPRMPRGPPPRGMAPPLPWCPPPE
ncbi:hypothetical protein Q9966_016166 [Columba livia]|nr:hypothetical protein Q9966_016166 [Columba livia]KAK2513340.1 hypothetical protein Q9966_016166 [Columba livia]KAK2513341.1 hypothetical protein Q9966_016166 [Columba livia]